MMRKSSEKNRKWIIGILFLSLIVTACEKQANKGIETDIELETEADRDTEISESAGRENSMSSVPENEMDAIEVESMSDIADVVTVYTPEGLKDSDEEIPVVYTDDLSLLTHMEQTDLSYACRDGRVYYRQYHKDSFEEAALWADYEPTAGADKEIVCIDTDGEKTVLFSDQGYGDIYLIGERFYMTEEVDGDYLYSNIYSVDMQGQNRIDYGDGKIYAFDRDRKVLILNIHAEGSSVRTYYALNCVSGEMTPLIVDYGYLLTFLTYHNGWCYFDVHQNTSDGITTDEKCRVVAVSLEGEQKEIMALASDNENADIYEYREDICEMRIVGERLYIVFGGYAGTGRCFQGGWIITTNLDGSDYRAVETYVDNYYVCDDAGRTLVYIAHRWIEDDKEYETTVWDVEANTVFPSNYPRQIICEQRTWNVFPYKEHIAPRTLGVLKDKDKINIYALPDDSGRIVRVAANINDDIVQRGDGEVDYIDYQHLYYADGFVYFDVVFNIYDQGCSIGWRDGYRRLQTDVYRLKLDENVMELLYSY